MCKQVLAVLIAAGMCACVASGQVTTATLYGQVVDPTGAIVPNAKVTLTHEDTGAIVTRLSDAQGEFAFDFLRVGRYAVRLEARGFKTYERTGLELVAGQQIRQVFPLELGSVTDVVKVEASAPLINTVSSEQLNTFETQKVRELPVPRRNFSTLLRIGTGVTYTGDSVRMNGVGKNGVAFTVDGTDAGGNPEGRNPSNYGTPSSSIPTIAARRSPSGGGWGASARVSAGVRRTTKCTCWKAAPGTSTRNMPAIPADTL